MGRASVCLALFWFWGSHSAPHAVGTWSHVVCPLRGWPCPPPCLSPLTRLLPGAEADGLQG